jgi:hypothetical protein
MGLGHRVSFIFTTFVPDFTSSHNPCKDISDFASCFLFIGVLIHGRIPKLLVSGGDD